MVFDITYRLFIYSIALIIQLVPKVGNHSIFGAKVLMKVLSDRFLPINVWEGCLGVGLKGYGRGRIAISFGVLIEYILARVLYGHCPVWQEAKVH